MLPQQTLKFVGPLVEWAAEQEAIKELWLVGSRARGNYRDYSDLDVVVMTTMDRSEAYNFFFWGEAEKLAAELSERLDVRVHFLQGDPDLQTQEVVRALASDCVRIFPERND